MGAKGSGRVSEEIQFVWEGQRLALDYEQRYHLTQKEAAAKLGVTDASWNRYRRAERRPRGNIAIQIEDLSNGTIPARSWWESVK